ncbi:MULTISPECIES: hypothetical protein [Klebsiella]|uniref:Uncharacterized protein n=1 Tax=Klebsiella michiganensis TaxID=1134687 RepID=A0A7H5A4N2_9ENTR|nr:MULTISPECIES: hypothetical protein [Klebsiella]ELA2913509.1 hypothetical protein [Klebsiella pneumoniae]EWF84143.1 hypothetical protein L373_04174 [Klebsiella michiganensis]KMH99971.1 hypothetical protein SM82_00974 [Klebsiella pneumoniae]MBK1576529.1 hypothetical protein [Klebsiella pneumoniae]HDG7980991.1 hypothetical protein [Klebsiella pneumoniae]
MQRRINTLCPYTLKSLDEVDCNGEHVLLAGLGVPDSFTVNASTQANKDVNKLLDEPFLSMGMIRFLSSISGVRSRSGEVKPFFSGVAEDIDEPVLVKLSPGEVVFKIQKPVKHDQDNNINAVVGYSDEVNDTLEKVTKKYTAKGFKIEAFELTSHETKVAMRLEMDLNLLSFQFVKTAYLTMVYLYGDDGINCVAGNEIRRRLLNKIPFNSQIEGLGTLEWDNNLIPILPDVHKNKHVIACINIGCDVLCAISLFGVFNKVLIFKNEKINESDLLGCVFNIDFRQRKITRENFAERILNNFYS